MSGIQLSAAAFLVVVFSALAYAWYRDLAKERREPFEFEVGESVIDPPFTPTGRYLTARFNDYGRLVVTERKRTWTGRKVYHLRAPGVSAPIRMREYQIIKDI